MSESNDTASGLLAFFSRPMVGIAGSIASIVGIALSVYFFQASREKPELTYFVHPAKAAVVRTGQTSRLSVQFDGQNLTSDITAAQIAFWNAGRRSIRSGAILSTLVIQTGNRARILEARLQKTSRDVIGLAVDSSRILSGEVEIRWSILEQNDGGVLQIVYVGDEGVKIQAHGILEGQPEVVRLDYQISQSTSGEVYTDNRGWKALLLYYFVIAMGSFTTDISAWGLFRRRQRPQGIRALDWAMATPGPLMIGAGIWALFFLRPPGPPFGF